MTEGLRGLDAAAVAEKRARGEINARTLQVSRSYRRILFENAVNPVYLTLYVISIVLVGLGLFTDALFTAGLVLVNVGVGTVQEARAKQRLDQISLLVRPRASAIREGEEQSIEPADIVIGDLLVLRAGDEVQVDGVLKREEGLSVDESLLTGESDAVRKREGDRIFSGTFVTAGSGVFEADRVGAESMAQQITLKARSFRNSQTPLQREVSLILMGMAIAVAVIGLAVINSFFSLHGGLPLKETARAAAVMVALVPQGLTFMITLTYVMAAVRIAGRGALVQRTNSVESMSHIDVLCTDKTGTLTTNQLILETVQPLDLDKDELMRRLHAFAASATLRNRTTEVLLEGDGVRPLPLLAEVPFDSARKWSAIACDSEPLRGVYVLGAPEVVAASVEERDLVEAGAAGWTSQGLRVLLFARRPQLDALDKLEAQELPPGMQALGLVVLRDQLRHEASETVASFSDIGIVLKVMSGDNPETVAALARQTGIASAGLVSGAELDRMDGEAFARAASETTIFGRISPDHKERLVEALQKRGHHVAMIGDGVNDIPALKRSNVAVAMRSGSPATRQIADIVLLQDSFSVLPAAFSEGQRIRNGMQSIIRPFLVRTISMSLIILAAALLGDDFPTTPRQAGLPAFFTVGLPALALAVWAQPGRTRQYLLPSSASFLAPASVLIAVAGVCVYHGFLRATDDLTAARTALTVTEVACGALLLPYVGRSTPGKGLFEPERRLIPLAAAMLAVMLVVLAVAPLRRLFELEALSVPGYAVVALTVVAWALALHAVWRLGARVRWPEGIRARFGPLHASQPAPGLSANAGSGER